MSGRDKHGRRLYQPAMSLARSTLVVALGAAGSRLLGFVRDVLIAGALGSGPAADAFLLAFRLPNLLRRVLGEGALNAGFVPGYARVRAENGAAAASRLAGEAFWAVALAAAGLVALVEVAAGLVVVALAAGYVGEPGLVPLATVYTRLAFPAVLGFALAALLSARLNAEGRFRAAALAPLAANAVVIAALLAVRYTELAPERAGIWLALAVSLSGFVHLAIVAAAGGLGRPLETRRPRLSARTRQMLRAGASAAFASGAAQFVVLAGTLAASYTPSAVSWLYYADRVFQLPLGFIGVAMGLVVLSDAAARHASGDVAGLLAAQNRALESALLLGVPAALALLVLAQPIATVLFERGAFTREDARGTAAVLAGLAPGLVFAIAGKVLTQAFFARGEVRVPLVSGALGVLVTLAAAPLLAWPLGVLGIGLGISLGCLAHAAALALRLRAAGWSLADARLRRRSWRILAAGLVMAAVLGGGLAIAAPSGPARPFALEAALLALRCAGGLLVYAGAAFAFGAVDRGDLWAFRRAR